MNGISSQDYEFSNLRFIAPFTCPLPSPSYYSSMYPLATGLQPSSPTEAFLSFSYNPHSVNPVFVSQAPKSWIWLPSPSHSQTPLPLHRKPCTSPIVHPRFSLAYFPSTSVCRCHPRFKLQHHYYTESPYPKWSLCLLHLPRK
jgi:hypothetical protein